MSTDRQFDRKRGGRTDGQSNFEENLQERQQRRRLRQQVADEQDIDEDEVVVSQEDGRLQAELTEDARRELAKRDIVDSEADVDRSDIDRLEESGDGWRPVFTDDFRREQATQAIVDDNPEIDHSDIARLEETEEGFQPILTDAFQREQALDEITEDPDLDRSDIERLKETDDGFRPVISDEFQREQALEQITDDPDIGTDDIERLEETDDGFEARFTDKFQREQALDEITEDPDIDREDIADIEETDDGFEARFTDDFQREQALDEITEDPDIGTDDIERLERTEDGFEARFTDEFRREQAIEEIAEDPDIDREDIADVDFRDGDVTMDDLRGLVDRFRDGEIDEDTVRDAVDAWRTGDQIDDPEIQNLIDPTAEVEFTEEYQREQAIEQIAEDPDIDRNDIADIERTEDGFEAEFTEDFQREQAAADIDEEIPEVGIGAGDLEIVREDGEQAFRITDDVRDEIRDVRLEEARSEAAEAFDERLGYVPVDESDLAFEDGEFRVDEGLIEREEDRREEIRQRKLEFRQDYIDYREQQQLEVAEDAIDVDVDLESRDVFTSGGTLQFREDVAEEIQQRRIAADLANVDHTDIADIDGDGVEFTEDFQREQAAADIDTELAFTDIDQDDVIIEGDDARLTDDARAKVNDLQESFAATGRTHAAGPLADVPRAAEGQRAVAVSDPYGIREDAADAIQASLGEQELEQRLSGSPIVTSGIASGIAATTPDVVDREFAERPQAGRDFVVDRDGADVDVRLTDRFIADQAREQVQQRTGLPDSQIDVDVVDASADASLVAGAFPGVEGDAVADALPSERQPVVDIRDEPAEAERLQELEDQMERQQRMTVGQETVEARALEGDDVSIEDIARGTGATVLDTAEPAISHLDGIESSLDAVEPKTQTLGVAPSPTTSDVASGVETVVTEGYDVGTDILSAASDASERAREGIEDRLLDPGAGYLGRAFETGTPQYVLGYGEDHSVPEPEGLTQPTTIAGRQIESSIQTGGRAITTFAPGIADTDTLRERTFEAGDRYVDTVRGPVVDYSRNLADLASAPTLAMVGVIGYDEVSDVSAYDEVGTPVGDAAGRISGGAVDASADVIRTPGYLVSAGEAAQAGAEVTGRQISEDGVVEGTVDTAETAGGAAVTAGTGAASAAAQQPLQTVGYLGGAMAIGAGAGRVAHWAGRAGRDRIRTFGREKAYDADELAPADVVRREERGQTGFPPARDRDLYETSPAEAVRQQAREQTPDELQRRFEDAGATEGVTLKKAIEVDPDGPGGAGFATRTGDYENPGAFAGPELSPHFFELDTPRSPSWSWRPGAPDLGTSPTAVAIRTDVGEADAKTLQGFNRELRERSGETTARTKPTETVGETDGLSPAEAEALVPPGAEFVDVGTGPLRDLSRRMGIGADYSVRFGGREIPIRTVADPDDLPDGRGLNVRESARQLLSDERGMVGGGGVSGSRVTRDISEYGQRADPGTARPMPHGGVVPFSDTDAGYFDDEPSVDVESGRGVGVDEPDDGTVPDLSRLDAERPSRPVAGSRDVDIAPAPAEVPSPTRPGDADFNQDGFSFADIDSSGTTTTDSYEASIPTVGVSSTTSVASGDDMTFGYSPTTGAAGSRDAMTTGRYPDTAYTPDTPYASDGPYTPGTPYTPDTPYASDGPYTPGTPYTPDTPYASDGPYTPGTPYTPDTPYASDAPYTPAPPAYKPPMLSDTADDLQHEGELLLSDREPQPDTAIAPGWLSETVADIATGGELPQEVTREELEREPFRQELTSELAPSAFRDEGTRERVGEIQTLFGLAPDGEDPDGSIAEFGFDIDVGLGEMGDSDDEGWLL